MLRAGWWGFVAASASLIGAGAGLLWTLRQRTIGAITAFGVGVLISALTFSLVEEAFVRGGFDAVLIGMGAGR